MIFDYLKSWTGEIEVNGKRYKSVQDALENAPGDADTIESIKLCRSEEHKASSSLAIPGTTIYRISVRKYMTQPSNPGFDFMTRWNNNVPMPLRTMVGYIERETPGMIFANLWGDITSETTQYCLRCGKAITNPVSQYFGMGPECGQHNYINPFSSKEELQAAIKSYRESYLQKITWKGWILKSAITEREELKNE